MAKTFLLLLPLLLVACTPQQHVIIQDQHISVEIADTQEERSQGLMYRKSLNKDVGMLFIFDSQGQHSFWMKNTLISLDMIWIDESLSVVDIKSVYPCTSETCESYTPIKEALYVLEVNLGFAQKNNINVGDTLEIK